MLISKFIVRHLSVLKRLVALFTFHITISRVFFHQKKYLNYCMSSNLSKEMCLKCYFMELIFLRISLQYFESGIFVSTFIWNWMTNTWTASCWYTPARTRGGCSWSPAARCTDSSGGSNYSNAIYKYLCLWRLACHHIVLWYSRKYNGRN